jgi:hypothetical protein
LNLPIDYALTSHGYCGGEMAVKPYPVLRRNLLAYEFAMPARLALFAGCLLWLSYESHFSPQFFVATVEASLAEIFGGIDDAIAAGNPVYVKTAAK